MKKYLSLTFQLAAVFIGTIVGAGLASGEEITLFFAKHGYKSFWGLLICLIIYITMGFIIIHISIKYKLKSYNEFIRLVSPGFLGQVTDVITSFFLLSGSAIILAGSGALLHQYFHISKWIGIILMSLLSLYILLKGTEGLLEINSFIVPCLIIIITTIFILFVALSKDIVSVTYIKSIPSSKNNWFISALLYAGFNIISCSGVLVPLSSEIRLKLPLKIAVILGSIGLTIIAFMINFMLILNIPHIFKYDIPLLYIANRFGTLVQIMLLCIMWLEMFSTEVSDIYSLGKTVENVFKISYKKSVILILLIAIPISQFGFVNLINYVYPAFGAISLVFIVQCIIFYYKECKKNKI
ncbi:transporter [Clostridium ganghwense]|uniref:Transporter n=1 Tax=Clostridium ganghwense TaxID=312089 RepID=A0ABT4CSE2_9CLOT|nr:transporter [Clostridium ganghwense]MCY6371991.1 transporter [Clostridium ganghwense]